MRADRKRGEEKNYLQAFETRWSFRGFCDIRPMSPGRRCGISSKQQVHQWGQWWTGDWIAVFRAGSRGCGLWVAMGSEQD